VGSGGGGKSARVSDSQQRGRDSDRRRILEKELAKEQSRLDALKQEYNDGSPERLGDERNYQKYLDRVDRLKDEVAPAAQNVSSIRREIDRVAEAGRLIQQAGMRFNAGHGLNYFNVQPVAALPGVRELHIGHAIVSRAVFVGDPLQLKPIMTVSDAALEHMRTHFGVDNHWLPNRHSAQTLADQATPWGRTTGPDDHQSWVGLPLVVHRRCDRPMFELANRIAYDGNMVYGTIAPRPDRETPAHLPTGWLHATGTSQGNWVAEEGRMLQALLAALRSDGVAPGDIAIVTPFRGVLKKIPALVRPYRGKGKTGKINCGTIHTMQGKEAPVVIMVLGGNTASPGARDWAVSEPNLLNVAATRAKRRFYVIGDRNDWQRRALFCDVMDLLPALDLHAEDIGGALHQKALASRDRARATGRYRSADEVLDGLRALRDEERTRRTAARKA